VDQKINPPRYIYVRQPKADSDNDSDKKRWKIRDVRELLELSAEQDAYGTKLAERGWTMHFISEVMRHHSLDYARRHYARFSPESAAKAVLKSLESEEISIILSLSAA
jgi:hypothetical protein